MGFCHLGGLWTVTLTTKYWTAWLGERCFSGYITVTLGQKAKTHRHSVMTYKISGENWVGAKCLRQHNLSRNICTHPKALWIYFMNIWWWERLLSVWAVHELRLPALQLCPLLSMLHCGYSQSVSPLSTQPSSSRSCWEQLLLRKGENLSTQAVFQLCLYVWWNLYT